MIETVDQKKRVAFLAQINRSISGADLKEGTVRIEQRFPECGLSNGGLCTYSGERTHRTERLPPEGNNSMDVEFE